MKSIGALTKVVGVPIKNEGDAYTIDRHSLILLWCSLLKM